MITRLRLENFKNFKDAELHFGSLTTLIGSNASGKSNLRDALRFLHGIGRGYKVAEIIGEKYGESGVLQWRGIRGGSQEISYLQSEKFGLAVDLEVYEAAHGDPWGPFKVTYSIEIVPGKSGERPRIFQESLLVDGHVLFTTIPLADGTGPRQFYQIGVEGQFYQGQPETLRVTNEQPILTQLSNKIVNDWTNEIFPGVIAETVAALRAMRFFDFHLDAMREPSFPGQTTLGDRGENLSSVLQAIIEVPHLKTGLLHWLQELTPMDVQDLQLVPDQVGRILINLVETPGRSISAYSASEGTLRFLAMLAALLEVEPERAYWEPKPTRFYFFEELENGLHPARLYLLLQLIMQETASRHLQVTTTTHSPQLLRFLDEKARRNAVLIFRQMQSVEGQIRRLTDIADINRVLETQDLGRLHESGWFEDAMAFLTDSTPEPEATT